MKTSGTLGSGRSLLPSVTLALAAVGLISTANAQVQIAGTLLVDVDATSVAPGALTSITNNGTLGGYFEARGGGTTIPAAANVHGNGSVGIRFDGGQYLQLVPDLGQTPTVPPTGIVGVNPTFTIEAWVLNPIIQEEETVVSWGKRGGPDGSNNSFNYGWNGAFGAMGHWGSPDMGWDSNATGGYAPRVPAPGVWHHLVYTFDGTTQKVYADGVEQNSENVSLDIAQNTSIVMGAQLEGDGATVTTGLRGSLSIARLRIHDEVLTSTQVANNYSVEASAINNGGAPLAAGPTHRYTFNQSPGAAPDGTVVPESISGANAVVRGAGAQSTGSRITLPGGPSSTQAYIDLPNGLLSNNSTNKGGLGEITLEGWVKITGARTWSRIFDFGSSDIGGGVGGEVTGAGGGGEGKDYFFWSAQRDGDLNWQQVAWRNVDPVNPGPPLEGGANDHYTSTAATFPKEFHFALTWRESTGLVEIYENGTLVSTMTMPIPMSDINDVNVWLGRSNWAGDQNTQAEYNEFRVYNQVLSQANLEASYLAGPESIATVGAPTFTAQPQNQSVNELTSASFFASANGAPPISLQWYKGTTLLSGATNNTMTLSNVLPADNGAQIYAVASNISGVVTSTVATLTVVGDGTAPTLTSARFDDADIVSVIFSEGVNAADLTTANITLTGPAGSPTITSIAPGATPNRAVLTLSGPVTGIGYYTITVSNVRDLSASQNVIAAGSTTSFWNLLPDGLAHRYTFNNQPSANATGATVPDTVGSADAVVKNGTGTTTFTGDKVTLSGGSSAVAPYVDLPNGIISLRSTNNAGSGQLTFEGWVRVTGVQSWARIFDFGSAGPCCSPGVELDGPGGGGEGIDYMFLSANNGTATGTRRIDLTNRDQGDHGTAGRDYGTTTFGQDFHFAVTWDETTGQVVMYENGVEVTRYTTVMAMNEINDVNVWLGRSNWTVDSNLQGEFDEFRVYNRVLDASEVQLNKAGGPNSALGAAQSLDLVVTNVSFYTNSVRALPVLVGFSNAGTQNVASLSSVVYTTTDPSVAEITAGGILRTYGVGSAEVTATFNGLTDSAEIVVSADNTPPMILSARAEGPQSVLVIFSEEVNEETGGEPFSYFVSTPYGNIDVEEATRVGDNTRVLLRLSAPMPPEYITVRSEWVTDMLGNTTDNNGTAGFVNFVPTNLKHRYTFNNGTNNLAANSVVPDAVGTADGMILGSPAVFTGERIVLFGGSSATAAYVDLPNNLFSNNSTNRGGSGQVTLETWVKVNGAQTWSRILDFGSTGPCCGAGGEITGTGGSGEGIDYLMLSAAIDSNPLRRRLEIQNRDQTFGFANGDYDTTTYQQMAHVMVTWDEWTGNVRVYENGVQKQSITTAAAMSDINDVNVWLGRSTWMGDANLQGEFDEFRLYNRVLTTNEVAMNIAAGPDNNFGAPVALRINAPALLNIGQVTPFSVVADFANISNVNLTLAGLGLVTSSNPSIVSNTPSGTLIPLDFGTATLRAVYSGMTNTVSIVVSNDTPIARDDGLTTSKDTAATVTTTTLLSNDEAPHGGALNVIAVSATSTNGGTVSFTAPNVTYTPAAGYVGSDLFTYTVSDAFGVEATGRVYVYVSGGPLPEPDHVAIGQGAGGSYNVSFRGTPGVTYRIQRAPEITGPWTTISTQTVTASGVISYTDAAPPAGQAFYRVVTP